MTNKQKIVAILGCGPTGLLAAHACELYGFEYVIYSPKVKSILGGAQFSHIPIPLIHDEDLPEAVLRYQLVGTAAGYREKVYGNSQVPFVSMENVKDGQEQKAWNLRGLYDILWSRFNEKIVDVKMDPRRIGMLPKVYEIIFSSVPLPLICLGTINSNVVHWFKSQTVRIYNEALLNDMPDNLIIYDGTDDHSYYRMSKIFGTGSTEWSGHSAVPPLPGLKAVSKPIDTNCDCYEGITMVGRFGTWKKGVLTSHAFREIVAMLEAAI